MLRRNRLLLGACVALGCVTWGATVVSERLVAPVWIEPAARAAYRIGFVVRFPASVVAEPFFPTYKHHLISAGTYYAVTSLLGPFVWIAAALVCRALWRAVRRMWRRRGAAAPPERTISRRAFLIRASSIAVPAGIAGHSVLIEPQRLRVARYAISVRDLPAALDGFRIVQISDTHYGPFVSLRYVRGAIEQANALEGDIVILTGDYVHKTPLAIGPGVDALKHVKARLGVVATLGNHDHWEGADAVRAAFAEIRVPLIDNARRFLTREGLHDEPIARESICIGGVGDLWTDRVDFARALADAPDAMPRILLAHNPDTAEEVPPGTRIDLMCSGHTHGGQVWVPGFGTPVLPSAYGQKYAGGLCQGPRCPVVVSRAVGMAVMPVRFCIPPELVEITLTRAG